MGLHLVAGLHLWLHGGLTSQLFFIIVHKLMAGLLLWHLDDITSQLLTTLIPNLTTFIPNFQLNFI